MKWRLNLKRNGTDAEVSDDGDLDELVIDDWFHLEQMDDGRWWIRVGKDAIEVNLLGGQVTVRYDKDRY
jgi:hypothetical protein